MEVYIAINEQIEYIYTFFKPEATARNRTVIQKIHYQKRKLLLQPTARNYTILTNLVKNAIKFSEEGSGRTELY
jgi:signal transduction histidine kinase